MDNFVIDLFNKKIIVIENNDITINFNILLSYPYIINNIVKFIYDKIKFIEYTNIIGIKNSVHIASILSYNHNIPILLLNKNNIVNGKYEDDNSTILFTDIIDSGHNILKYMSILKSNKVNVNYIFTIYNKSSKNLIGNEIISLLDYNYINKLLISKNIITHYFNIDPLLNKIRNIITKKSSKLCYNCTLTNIKDIITDVDNIGKYIVMLKVCSNNITDFNINYGSALKKLAYNHNFIIINDLGIYDTKHINIEHYKWCDVLTTYNQYLKCEHGLIYINNGKCNITTNILGVIGGGTLYSKYLHISNTINNIHDLKNNINNKYDLITIDDTFCNEKIIKYINTN